MSSRTDGPEYEDYGLCYWHTDPSDPCQTAEYCGARTYRELLRSVKANEVLKKRMDRLEEEHDRKCLDVMMWIADELARRRV